jgi:hypothetical protein
MRYKERLILNPLILVLAQNRQVEVGVKFNLEEQGGSLPVPGKSVVKKLSPTRFL